MKPLLTAIAAVLFLLLPAPGFPAYIIHLHDGTQLVTDQYFEDGDQIKFKRYGGLIGIEKERIREIEKTEALPKDQGPSSRAETPASASEAVNKQQAQDRTERAKPIPSLQPSDDAGESQRTNAERGDKVPQEGGADATGQNNGKIQSVLDKKRQIMAERVAIYLAFKKAEANDNTEEQQRLRKAMLQIQAKLSELRDTVKANNGGELPPWWDPLD
jgi:hypothetical protein